MIAPQDLIDAVNAMDPKQKAAFQAALDSRVAADSIVASLEKQSAVVADLFNQKNNIVQKEIANRIELVKGGDLSQTTFTDDEIAALSK